MNILFITGGRHPYHLTTPIISKYLRNIGHKVRVTRSAKELNQVPLLKYDVIVMNSRRGGIDEGETPKNRRIPRVPASERNNDFTDTQKHNFKWFVETGGGLVSIHISPDSCPGWKEWMDVVGGGWVGLQQPATKKGQPDSTHPPFARFLVKITDKKHPCVEGVEDFYTDDELYYNLQLPNNLKVFMEAEYDGRSHPMGYSTSYKKGKIVHIPLGHSGVSVDNPSFLKVVENSIQFVSKKS